MDDGVYNTSTGVKTSSTADGAIDYYLPTIIAYSDYDPFGTIQDGRKGGASDYRYGFQGQEMDDEIKGEGNSVNYEYRMHDPRIGRFFAVDPLAPKYPYYTPYQFSGNRPIDCVELEGLEPAAYNRNDGETVYGDYSVWGEYSEQTVGSGGPDGVINYSTSSVTFKGFISTTDPNYEKYLAAGWDSAEEIAQREIDRTVTQRMRHFTERTAAIIQQAGSPNMANAYRFTGGFLESFAAPLDMVHLGFWKQTYNNVPIQLAHTAGIMETYDCNIITAMVIEKAETVNQMNATDWGRFTGELSQTALGAYCIAGEFSTISGNLSSELPVLGRKLDYVFGKATGNAHNIDRSTGMLRQLESIGIFDNTSGRAIMRGHLGETYNKIPGVLQSNGRYSRNSLLMGPNGGLGVESIWEGNSLVTIKLFGR